MDHDKESKLREVIGYGNIGELPGIPVASWDVLSQQMRSGRYILAVDTSAGPFADQFARGWSRFLRLVIVTLPITNAVVLLVATFLLSNYWLLLGIPLLFVAQLLAPPVAVRGAGSVVLASILILLCIFGPEIAKWIAGSMLAQFLSRKCWYRSNATVLRNQATTDEAAFVFLFSKRICSLIDTQSGTEISMPIAKTKT